jgi:PAS domain S-box-containing protein
MVPTDPDHVKTTVRLPRQLHQSMKERLANSRGDNIESFIAKAIERELLVRRDGAFLVPNEWTTPLTAQRFLEFMPTPAVIKDREARIVWCNAALEDLFGRSRGELVGREVSDLGVVDAPSAVRLARDFRKILDRGKTKAQFWEPVSFATRGGQMTLFRAHRFVFRLDKVPFVGDISFDWQQMRPGLHRKVDEQLVQRIRSSPPSAEIARLFEPFLEACPVAIAIKTVESKVVWCNEEYAKLVGENRNTVAGSTTAELFNLPATHPIVQNEDAVARAGVWMYATERLPRWKPRTSLRFPIYRSPSDVVLIGVVSAEFQQGDITDSPWKEKYGKAQD